MTRSPLPPEPVSHGDGEVLVVQAPSGRRGAVLRAALGSADPAPAVVVVLPDGVTDPEDVAEALAAPLLADEDLVLVKAVPPAAHPLDDLLARPLLELHAPALAAVHSPLAQAWAIRTRVLADLALPPGDEVDVAVLVDVHRDHGLGAIAQVPVDLPAPGADATGTLSYSVLAAVGERARGGGEGPRPGGDERFTPGPRSGAPSSAW
jgi:hypothetical protein